MAVHPRYTNMSPVEKLQTFLRCGISYDTIPASVCAFINVEADKQKYEFGADDFVPSKHDIAAAFLEGGVDSVLLLFEECVHKSYAHGHLTGAYSALITTHDAENVYDTDKTGPRFPEVTIDGP